MTIVEKRHFSRISFDAPVVIETAGTAWQSTLVDISLKGLLAERPALWQAQEGPCHVTVHLPGQDISMDTELVHEEDDAIGFKYIAIDLDSIATLRRMVELNLGDEKLLQREISAMIAQVN